MKPKVIELFAGAGGLALGLEQAGFDHTILIENNKDAVNTLKTNRPDWDIIDDTITNVDFKNYSVDLVTGGFPCQPFSTMGKELGFNDTRGTLFFEFARTVKEVKPKMFIAENVPGLLQNDKGKTIRTIVKVLQELNYKVRYKILNAVNYNVPQIRRRVFIVGMQDNLHFDWPEPFHKKITLREALKDIPKSEGFKYTEWKKEILKLVPAGGNWRSLPTSQQKRYLGAMYGKRNKASAYTAHRLSWEKIPQTLTCNPLQKMNDKIHPDETRPLSIREYARIQSFPDSWIFTGSISSQYKQIGNAVPVNLAAAVGKAAHKTLCNPHLIQNTLWG